jgi:hypothetical protein
MSDKPTDRAKEKFGRATTKAYKAENHYKILKMAGNRPVDLTDREWGDAYMADALQEIASGLWQLSSGLRATYMLLEQIQAKLPR